MVLSTDIKKNKNVEGYLEFINNDLIIIMVKKEDLNHFFLEFFNLE
jgi:hypothetical protein